MHANTAGQTGARSGLHFFTDDFGWSVCFMCIFALIVFQGTVPTREAINIYYQEQMMKTSRESDLDHCTHRDEGPVSAGRGREEDDGEEAGRTTDKIEPVPGKNYPKDSYTEPGPGGDAPDKLEPEPVSGDEPGELHTKTGPETVLGRDCVDKTELETVSGAATPDETDLASGADSPDEAPAEAGSTERDPAVEEYPECIVATTSQRPRAKLSRIKQVQSSLSSSSEGEITSHRLVLQMAALSARIYIFYLFNIMLQLLPFKMSQLRLFTSESSRNHLTGVCQDRSRTC